MAAMVVSKVVVLLVVLQLLLVAVAPASATGSWSSSELGTSRRLLQVVGCVDRSTTVSDCSKPCCDPVHDVCATVEDGLGGVFHTCVPRTSCGRNLVSCN